jgi:hypothetical protein
MHLLCGSDNQAISRFILSLLQYKIDPTTTTCALHVELPPYSSFRLAITSLAISATRVIFQAVWILVHAMSRTMSERLFGCKGKFLEKNEGKTHLIERPVFSIDETRPLTQFEHSSRECENDLSFLCTDQAFLLSDLHFGTSMINRRRCGNVQISAGTMLPSLASHASYLRV